MNYQVVQCSMPLEGFEEFRPAALNEGEISMLLKIIAQRIVSPVQAVYYWYGVGCYEGTGYVMAVCKDGTIVHAGLCHCSCYGPTEDTQVYIFDSFEEYKKSLSAQCTKEVSSIIAAHEAVLAKIAEEREKQRRERPWDYVSLTSGATFATGVVKDVQTFTLEDKDDE